MIRLITAFTASAVLAATLTAAASIAAAPAADAAAPIKECGNYSYEHARWTYGPVYGTSIANLTTRRVSCASARRMVRGVTRMSSYAFRCNYRQLGDEYTDIRCTGDGGRVIRYQTGS